MFGILAKPWQVEPTVARAFNVIADTISFLRGTDDACRNVWFHQSMATTTQCSHSICQHACDFFHLTVHDAFYLSFKGSQPIPFLDLHFRDVKSVLQMLETAATSTALEHPEKTSGQRLATWTTMQPLATMLLHRDIRNSKDTNKYISFRELCIVGSNLTLDRKAAIEKHDQSVCRFCGNHKESMNHLTKCDALNDQLPRPFLPECGSNFEQLGIVEVSHQQMIERLQLSQVSDIPVAEWSEGSPSIITFWTDVCVKFSSHFWKTQGSCAVVNMYSEVTSSGRVYHWALSAYITELWAVLQAFVRSPSACCIVSDCKSVVQQTLYLIVHDEVPQHWTLRSWWNFLFNDYQKEKVCTPHTFAHRVGAITPH